MIEDVKPSLFNLGDLQEDHCDASSERYPQQQMILDRPFYSPERSPPRALISLNEPISSQYESSPVPHDSANLSLARTDHEFMTNYAARSFPDTNGTQLIPIRNSSEEQQNLDLAVWTAFDFKFNPAHYRNPIHSTFSPPHNARHFGDEATTSSWILDDSPMKFWQSAIQISEVDGGSFTMEETTSTFVANDSHTTDLPPLDQEDVQASEVHERHSPEVLDVQAIEQWLHLL